MSLSSAELERLIIIVCILAVAVGTLRSMLLPGRTMAPQVPPTVAPMYSPLDEDVRQLRHWRSNVDQQLPDLAGRVVKQGQELSDVRGDLAQIKEGMKRNEHMLQIITESLLKGERE